MKSFNPFLWTSLFLIFINSATAQVDIKIKTIADDWYELIGTNIMVRGMAIGARSDFNGDAILTLPNENKNFTVDFSYTNFKPKSITVNPYTYNGETIKVELIEIKPSKAEQKRVELTQKYINQVTKKTFLKRQKTKTGIIRKATFLNKTDDHRDFYNRAVEVTIFDPEDEISLFALNSIPENANKNSEMYSIAWEGYTNALYEIMDNPESAGIRDDLGPNLKKQYNWILQEGVKANSLLQKAITTANLENCKIKNEEIKQVASHLLTNILRSDSNYQIQKVSLIIKPFTEDLPYSAPLGIKVHYQVLHGYLNKPKFDVYFGYNQETKKLEIQKDMA